jgi:hypothetical protein
LNGAKQTTFMWASDIGATIEVWFYTDADGSNPRLYFRRHGYIEWQNFTKNYAGISDSFPIVIPEGYPVISDSGEPDMVYATFRGTEPAYIFGNNPQRNTWESIVLFDNTKLYNNTTTIKLPYHVNCYFGIPKTLAKDMVIEQSLIDNPGPNISITRIIKV